MDSLSAKRSPGDIREALAALPAKLDETNDQAMQRIEDQDTDARNLARNVLSWISHAYQPLTVAEIQQALATKEG
jgi:hypothetical protein